jgi:hypothetical protein
MLICLFNIYKTYVFQDTLLNMGTRYVNRIKGFETIRYLEVLISQKFPTKISNLKNS